ncbi:MAG: asparagine synthase (glutamine-hydrolyzing) [Emcibacteraceae bacterium]|nr:asparagine synthase (glutamine-hydrolyzing) [Emcibacteraceae bacterium]
MCGLVGVLGRIGSQSVTNDLLVNMTDVISHRGPDDSGIWMDENTQIGLGHRRLSIVDISSAGHQPMPSNTGRFILAYNGEIYNHLDLRKEIEAIESVNWKGHSDTETLLVGFDIWGIEETIKKSTGMFAFAVWDKVTNKLTLGRDRLGEKPLYYGWHGETLLFGSELKALKSHPEFNADINRDALALYLRHFYIPAPYSIYKNVKKLLPGHLLEINAQDKTETYIEYWSFKEISENHEQNLYQGNEDEAVEELEKILKKSIKQQMMADVPLGAFLSGGIDSSTVVALMQAQSERPIKTFSIGFNEEGYDEAVHARAVAEHLGTEHTELYVTSEQAMSVISKLAKLYDEPFADSSQIPTYLVSKMAKEHVTVSLSGDAGDELFCGYNRYVMTHNLWAKLSKIPRPIRSLCAFFMTLVSVKTWNNINKIIPTKFKMANLGDKMHKAANVLTTKTVSELYKGLVSTWNKPDEIVINSKEPLTALNDPKRTPNLTNDVEKMMAIDTISYLPDDILAKVDRASMGVSLEGRIPFLNHKVVEFAWTLPLEYKLRGGITKWCLKEVLYKHVPKSIMERPKMGFGVPIDEWLRGPLKEWAEKLIDESRLKKEGFFEPKIIQKVWQEHQSGKRNWQHKIWAILMFQLWYEEYHK